MEQRAGVNGFLLIATKLEGGDGQVRPPGLILENTEQLLPAENRAKSAWSNSRVEGLPLAPGTLLS